VIRVTFGSDDDRYVEYSVFVTLVPQASTPIDAAPTKREWMYRVRPLHATDLVKLIRIGMRRRHFSPSFPDSHYQ
jgi:hypothetical protein